jgi:hypothetical protein
MQSLNYFVIGPLTSKTMFQRQKLEKDEGKDYKDASALFVHSTLDAHLLIQCS